MHGITWVQINLTFCLFIVQVWMRYRFLLILGQRFQKLGYFKGFLMFNWSFFHFKICKTFFFTCRSPFKILILIWALLFTKMRHLLSKSMSLLPCYCVKITRIYVIMFVLGLHIISLGFHRIIFNISLRYHQNMWFWHHFPFFN